MAKRIYFESLKKWLIGSGITVGTLVGGLFLYLNLMGLIEITGHSGDSVCEGTINDPCFAYINLTAKDDIFIYPVGYDPWGRNTFMQFAPGVKDWKLQRSWGNGWRDIPLNETCTGTWCGAPNNKGVAYSYVLRKDRDYQFRIIAYKNSPYDKIKWAINYDDKEYLDPEWKSPYEVTRTESSDTICRDGVCNLILHSGIKNIYEDGVWKKIENARSLKNSGFEIIYLENDSDFDLEVIDFNLTSITVRLNSAEKNKNIPIRIWQTNKTKKDTYEKYTDKITKLENAKSQDNYKNSYSKVLNEAENFGLRKKTKTYDFGLNNILEFGFNSTTIKLQTADTENLADVYGNDGTNYLTQIKWNITSIPSDQVIDDSTICLHTPYSTIPDNDVRIWRVDDQSWTESISAATMDSQSLTNQTDDTFSSITTGTWCCTNVTKMIKTDYDLGNDNASIRLEDIDALVGTISTTKDNDGLLIGSLLEALYINDKENIFGSGNIPYLNITYSASGDTVKPTYSNNAHNTTVAGTSVKFSIQYDDNTALHPKGQYIFSTNNTGTWTNESAVNFTATPSWANVTKTLNSTSGISIGYRWYADDNAGNINNTGIFTLTTTTAPSDTCNPTSPLTSNHAFDCSDNCTQTNSLNASGYNLTFYNSGYINIHSNITSFDKIIKADGCKINVLIGTGSFVK